MKGREAPRERPQDNVPSTPLRVLVVEDSEYDAMLLVEELRRGDYEPVYERVCSAEEMEEALEGAQAQEEDWQIIVSDYYMPRFSGPDALALLRRLGYDTPFIVVSGKIGEEAAVAMMRAGAQDYVTKDNMARLCPAIERELREAAVRKEREEAQEALKASENRFRRLVEQAADAMLVFDLEGNLVDVNRRACEALGYTSAELLRMSMQDVEVGRATEDLGRLWEEVSGGEPCTFEGVHRRRDGTTFPVEVRVGVFELRGRPLMLALARDVTERKEAEKRLREAERRFRTLVEQTPAITYIQSPDGNKPVEYVSPQLEEVLGYSPKEVVIDDDFLFRTVYPEDRERFVAEDRRTDETGEPFRIEYRMTAKDGRIVWIRDEAVLVRDEKRDPLYWLGVQYDITDLKRIEENLRESEERYRAVVEQTGEGIFVFDPRTKRILEANRAFQEMFGYSPEELGQTTLYELVPQDPKGVDRNVEHALKQRQVWIGERSYRRKDGSRVDVEVSGSVISYGGREVVCSVVHDITERKEAERRLSEAREAERNRIARDLHDDILQDIVYALQEIQIVQITSPGGGDEALEDAADALRRSVEGLRGAIFELRVGALSQSFFSALETLLDLNRRMARNRYELVLTIEDAFPPEISERAGRQLTRIVQEALTNVRRHAGARRVEVRLWREGETALVEVADDGRGFDVQASSVVGVGQQSMVQRVSEIGGELEVESAPAKGTRVRVRVSVLRLVGAEEAASPGTDGVQKQDPFG